MKALRSWYETNKGKIWTLFVGVGCLLLGLGVYNIILNLLEVPPIRLSLPYLIVGALIVAISVVKKPWLRK